jgi:hypothetical protein
MPEAVEGLGRLTKCHTARKVAFLRKFLVANHKFRAKKVAIASK